MPAGQWQSLSRSGSSPNRSSRADRERSAPRLRHRPTRMVTTSNPLTTCGRLQLPTGWTRPQVDSGTLIDRPHTCVGVNASSQAKDVLPYVGATIRTQLKAWSGLVRRDSPDQKDSRCARLLHTASRQRRPQWALTVSGGRPVSHQPAQRLIGRRALRLQPPTGPEGQVPSPAGEEERSVTLDPEIRGVRDKHGLPAI